jgi:hypothetical protein
MVTEFLIIGVGTPLLSGMSPHGYCVPLIGECAGGSVEKPAFSADRNFSSAETVDYGIPLPLPLRDPDLRILSFDRRAVLLMILKLSLRLNAARLPSECRKAVCIFDQGRGFARPFCWRKLCTQAELALAAERPRTTITHAKLPEQRQNCMSNGGKWPRMLLTCGYNCTP